MHPRWKWYHLYTLLILVILAVLDFTMSATLLAEKVYRGLAITLAVFGLLALSIFSFVQAVRSGRLQSRAAHYSLQAGALLTTIFIVLLFVPTGDPTGSTEFGSTEVTHQQRPRYDARQQPGADLYVAMEAAVPNDQLTLTIYDICVGKVTHRIHRDGPCAEPKLEITDPTALTAHIKEQALALGAKCVGVAQLSPEFVFTHDQQGRPIGLGHRFAVVIGKDLDYLLAVPSAPLPWQDLYSSMPEELAAVLSGKMVKSNAVIPTETVKEVRESLRFFSEGGKTAVELARYIRGLGHSARAHYQRWSEVQIVPLAIQAGLGELTRNGMLVSGRLGPRGSFAVVTTDLPLIADTPERLGIKEFCEVCTKCAQYCPIKAIPFGRPEEVRGVLKWTVDGEKCGQLLVNNPKCMACIAACPYNKPDYWVHRAAFYMTGRRSRLTNYLLLKLDDLLGYGDFATEQINPATGG
jgi:reductive dehalogenase